MTKDQLGPILSALANKYPVIDLTPEDQAKTEQIVNDLKAVFDAYPKKP